MFNGVYGQGECPKCHQRYAVINGEPHICPLDKPTIDKSVLYEILRKLTPAIGRVLETRKKVNPEQCRYQYEESYIAGYNSALEQVLDADFIEPSIKMWAPVYPTLVYLVDDGLMIRHEWDVALDFLIKWADLLALVAEAWQV